MIVENSGLVDTCVNVLTKHKQIWEDLIEEDQLILQILQILIVLDIELDQTTAVFLNF